MKLDGNLAARRQPGKVGRLRTAVALLGALAAFGALQGTPLAHASASASGALEAIERAAEAGRWAEARLHAAVLDDPLALKLVTWLELTDDRATPAFADLIAFVRDNPTWPQVGKLRRRAELAIPADWTHAEARAWFSSFPPLSPAGATRYAEALLALGDASAATEVVRRFWVSGGFGAVEEKDFRRRFGSLLGQEDHWSRLDRLLWDGEHAAAQRMMELVDAPRRSLAEARLLLATMQPGVDAAIRRVPESLRNDPGLLYERLRWRRRKGLDDGALEILASQPADLVRPAAWWTERHIVARRALERGDHALVYRLAKSHGQTDGLGFAQAEWLAGWVALRFLNRPDDALAHFERLHANVGAPISLARGAYWAARAAEAAGRADEARRWYERAAAHATTFYGQLAADRLGQPVATRLAPDPVVGPDVRSTLEGREHVRAARWLGAMGDRRRSEMFLRRLASDAATPAEVAAVAALAVELGRLDLGVMAAKEGVQKGTILFEHAYPILGAPPPAGPEPALVHALIRQESTFDHAAVSAAGARGLMQLMPSTAREVARRLGAKGHSDGMLIADPAYNVRLGTSYLRQMLDEFGGSYVLAIAAYNAGPARVRGWLRELGDPRDPRVDPIDWIEQIPIYETRNYVQRVLEGVQVYRVRLAGAHGARTLSEDLGT